MRAAGKDLAEIFGYAPDDTTDAARKQWKSQNCPFTNSGCVKHGHAQAGATPEVNLGHYRSVLRVDETQRNSAPERRANRSLTLCLL